MRLNTKAKRTAAREASINYAIKAGYTLEKYKELSILTSEKNDLIMLKVYKDTTAKEEVYKRYRTIEARAEAIENIKANYNSRLAYKEERKKEGKQLTEAARAAKAIKAELKEHFQSIKFSVKSDNFSMGDSVHVSWENGPTTNEVEAIIKKYQYGSFNSMEDMYENTNSREDLPQSKYVQTSREKSEELENILNEFTKDLEQQNKDLDLYHISNFGYQIFYKTSILPDAYSFKIEQRENTCGIHEDFYKLTFEAPEQAPKKEVKETTNFEPVEVPEGEIQIIDYSTKAIAVIGDTKPLKEGLKSLGGRFNFRLSCGPGWIFPKTKLEELTAFLSQGTKEEIQKTVQFFADTDIQIYGEITEGTREAAKVQEVEILGAEVVTKPVYTPGERELKFMALADKAEIFEEEPPEQHKTLESITAAAKAGQQISLFNLSQLI